VASTRPTPTTRVDALSTPIPTRIWPAIVARLKGDDELSTILGTAREHDGRVVGASTRAERVYTGDPRDVWGRVVVLPVVRLAAVTELAPNAPRVLPFLVRVDANDPERDDYDPRGTLAAAHARIYRLLAGWTLAVPGARVVRGLWRETEPGAGALLDPDGAVVYASAEWRCEIVPHRLT
jgi:hypothetical protein